MGVPYVMRCPRNFMSAEFRSCEAAGGDLELELGRCLIPVRPARAYGRDGLRQNHANRYSNTHKRAF